MTTRPRHPARDDEEEPSASGAAAESRSDGFAISPGIGPVPAIYVPPGQVNAGTAGQARRSRDEPHSPRLGRHLRQRVLMRGTMPDIPADLRYSKEPDPGERDPARVVAFSDAVIAIAVTLL